MQPSARAHLVSLVEEHLAGLISEATAIQRHAKRARINHVDQHRAITRRRLHAADINLALQLRGSEKLYGTNVVMPNITPLSSAATSGAANVNAGGANNKATTTSQNPNKNLIDLQDVVNITSTLPLPPSEVNCHRHWLAIDGIQPAIPENPIEEMGAAGPNRVPPPPTSAVGPLDTSFSAPAWNGTNNDLLIQQLQQAMLSEDLQLYFVRVTAALEQHGPLDRAARQQQEAVLTSLRTDVGLQELVPFFVRYLQHQLSSNGIRSDPDQTRLLLQLAMVLLQNPHLHLELHLHELLPLLMTCVVATSASSSSPLLAATAPGVRAEAARALVQACHLFAPSYGSLKARVLRTLGQALSSAHLGSQLGALLSLSKLGPAAVDAFAVPAILHYWRSWEHYASATSNGTTSLSAAFVQQAALSAMTVFGKADAETKWARVNWNDLEEVLGEHMVPIGGLQTEYALAFV